MQPIHMDFWFKEVHFEVDFFLDSISLRMSKKHLYELQDSFYHNQWGKVNLHKKCDFQPLCALWPQK